MDYMFDTETFNMLLDASIDLKLLRSKCNRYYVTHIQRDEIQATRDLERRNQLLAIFHEVSNSGVSTESAVVGVSRVGEAKLGGSNMVPTESAIWGVSSWGQCKWTADDNLYEPIKKDLDNYKRKKSNLQDALIAETSIKNGFILVSNDKALNEILPKYGGEIIRSDDFIASISNL